MKNKRIIKLFAILTLILLLPFKTNATSIDTTKKIYDYAEIFTETEEKEIYNTLNELIQKYKTDLVIVTINENPNSTAERYATLFYDENNFGDGSDKEGVLLLIDFDTREYYILTTGISMKIVNDYRVEKILTKMETAMKNGEYLDATKTYLKEINKYYSYHKYGPPLLWIIAIIGGIIIGNFRLKREKKKLDLIKDVLEASNYVNDGHIDQQSDQIIKKRTQVIHNVDHSGGGGGGHSSHSGGGSSHGGGGRHF